MTNMPLQSEQIRAFNDYLISDNLPWSKIYITNATSLLERGQYSLSIFDSARSVEYGLTEYVILKLKNARKSNIFIKNYRKTSFNDKLKYSKPDLRSLETYFHKKPEFSTLKCDIKNNLKNKRNAIVHHAYQASRNEAKEILNIAKSFRKLIS